MKRWLLNIALGFFVAEHVFLLLVFCFAVYMGAKSIDANAKSITRGMHIPQISSILKREAKMVEIGAGYEKSFGYDYMVEPYPYSEQKEQKKMFRFHNPGVSDYPLAIYVWVDSDEKAQMIDYVNYEHHTVVKRISPPLERLSNDGVPVSNAVNITGEKLDE